MKHFLKKQTALLLTLSLTLGLSACGNANDSATSTSDDNTLIYGSADYTSINPIMNEHCEIKSLLFDGLMARDGDGTLIPALAASYTYDEDTLTYTFALRDDVTWHDGEKFTAEDVKFTIEAIMDPDNGSENAPNYEEVSEINIISDTEIAFTLSEPNAAFLDYMTMSILPKHLLDGEDMWESDFFKHPIGTGPYKLENWDVGQSITMVRNDDYYKGAANIETIIFKVVEDDNAKTLQLQSHELDLAQVTPKDVETFVYDDSFSIYDMQTSDYRGILYNFANDYWQENADLIPAISCAIDREAILNTVVLGYGEVAYSPIQQNEYNYEDVERYDYDLDRAVRLMEEAGCKKDDDGYWRRDGVRIGFTLNASPDDQVRIDMAQLAAQQLQDFGIDVNANVPTEGIDWANQDACIIGWGSPFDADDHTYKVFGTDKGANYSSYSNEAVDQYLTEARQTFDTTERAEAYKNFQIALAAQPAYTYFCYIDAIYIADSSLQGIDTATILGHHGVGIFWNVCEWTLE